MLVIYVLTILSKPVNVAMSYRRIKTMTIAVSDFSENSDFRPVTNKSIFLFIFRRLLLVSASTDFDEIFSIRTAGIILQNVLFKLCLQT